MKFKTDNCTMFPEGTLFKPTAWKECCLKHDLQYWMGGDKRDEAKSDNELQACVESKGYFLISHLMYIGVKLGKFSPFKISGDKVMKYHWGWGRFPNKRIYKERSQKNAEMIKSLWPVVKNSPNSFYIP